MNENVIIFGNGQMAELVYTYIKDQTDHVVCGFTCDQAFIDSSEYLGLPLVSFEEIHSSFPPESHKLFIVTSAANNNQLRKERYLAAKSKGYQFISFISPDAKVYSTSKIGENCFILEDNTIQHFSSIGDNVVMWSGNHLGHHSTISSHTFVTSHVVISGRCEIGSACFLGVNSTIRDGLSIGERAVIGSGANIMKNIPENSIVIGLPGKIISSDSSTANLY